MKSILAMTDAEARDFLLSPESYCTFDLPTYVDLAAVLDATEAAIGTSADYRNGGDVKPGDLDNVNHLLLTNKDGAYAWRPFQLIHPALYIELVNAITDATNWRTIKNRFVVLQANEKISCKSIPMQGEVGKNKKETSISNWWQSIEQESIRLSLHFKYLTTADITDCYGALYTHTVAWAIHTKSTAKASRRDNSLVGNQIDSILQDMQNRQTNGIPQGSVVSDLIAEIVLGYADEQLTTAITDSKITDYKILRYRDDYRIFTNTSEDGKKILLLLTKVLADLSFKLNSSKTRIEDEVITNSIKPDKRYWLGTAKKGSSPRETLLIIRELGIKYPNSGKLKVILGDFRKEIDKLKKRPANNDVLIPIVVDIMYNNPGVYPTAASILSKLLSFESDEKAKEYIGYIAEKFRDIPNIGHLDIWLQRISVNYDRSISYEEKLCRMVAGSDVKLWNSNWLPSNIKQAVEGAELVNESVIKGLNRVIPLDETELFLRTMFYPAEDYGDE